MALGIGSTIQDLQTQMSYREFLVWCSYREKYGPLNPVRMYDQAGGIVASQINKAHGGKANPIDFMPYAPKVPEKEATAEDFMAALGKGVKIGR